MDVTLKRSQITLSQLQDVLSEYFILERRARGRGEWLEGRVRPHRLLDVGDVGGLIRMQIPRDEAEANDRIGAFLARFPSSLYRLNLRKVDRRTLTDLLKSLQGLGVDIGFVEQTHISEGEHLRLRGGERFRWPDDHEDQLSIALEISEVEARPVARPPLIDLDFFILSIRSITRRRFRTASLAVVLSLVCANFIYHVSFSISGEGVTILLVEQWELPLAAGLMSLLIFFNLMEISLNERMLEIGTIRALGAETTTTLLIFAAEGMTIGAIGALLGYVIVLVIALITKFGGINPSADLVAMAGPGRAILGLFLGLLVGFVGSVLPVFPVLWRSPEKCMKPPK